MGFATFLVYFIVEVPESTSRRIWYIRRAPLILTLTTTFFVGGVVSEFVQSFLPVRSGKFRADRSGRNFSQVTSCPISSDLPYSSTSLIFYINVIDVRAKYHPSTNHYPPHHIEMLRGGSTLSRRQVRPRRGRRLGQIGRVVMSGTRIRTRKRDLRSAMSDSMNYCDAC